MMNAYILSEADVIRLCILTCDIVCCLLNQIDE